jgi:di/tricarboxylate transporter
VTQSLAGRSLDLIKRHNAWLAVGLFAAAIISASLGLLYLPIALAAVVASYAILNVVQARHVYDAIEWPVIVLLGSMIPIGGALESSGGTALIVDDITTLSAGDSPVFVLILLMVVTMTLPDVMNNTLIMGPGGYRFRDHRVMGLPLEILVIIVSIPMIMWVWPL